MQYTFIGDTHSAADDLKVLLQAKSIQNSRLVFLGDYIDGRASRNGSNHPNTLEPLAVLDIIMTRVNEYGDDLSYQTWRLNGGARTWRQLGIHSSNLTAVADALNHEPLSRYTKFLTQLPLTWENQAMMAMHAGVDWTYPLDQQVRDDLLWIRDDYYFDQAKQWHRNLTKKVMITGHTPVQTIRDNGYGLIKMQADEQDVPRYLIDAGSRSGAQNGGIFALTLSENGDVIAKNWVVSGQLLDGNLPYLQA